MFNRLYRLSHTVKLISVVMISALLLWMPVIPVASQLQPPSPWTPPFRPIIKGGLNALAGALTASEGDILDVENFLLSSHPGLTAAYIPLHPVSRSWERLLQLLVDKKPVGPVNIGALYLENDFPGRPELKAGLYTLQIDNDLNWVAVDAGGNEIVIGKAECQCTFVPPQPNWNVRLGQFTVMEVTPFKILLVIAIISAIGAAVEGCTDRGCNCNCNCGGGGG